MSLSLHQQNIVNPYPQEQNPGGGLDYDFNSARNQWVTAGIHDSYINYGIFPNVGKELRVGGPIQNNNTITSDDLIAYLSLYPQNGKFNFEEQRVEFISLNESHRKLEEVASSLRANNLISLYISPTSPEAQIPQNQGDLTGEGTEEEQVKQQVAQLISIPYDMSQDRLNSIRLSFGLGVPIEDPIQSAHIEMENDPSSLNDGDLDMSDWILNVPPGTFAPKIYYNYADSHYYYAARTNVVDPAAYDIGREESVVNVATATSRGIMGILQFSGKYTPENLQLGVNNINDEIEFLSYIDHRPDSRWLYLIKISRSFIDSLQGDDSTIDLQNEQISPYQKSLIIINGVQNNITKHAVYSREYLQSNIPTLINTLRHYEDLLSMQKLNDGRLDGLKIENEIDRINSFEASLDEFIYFNKISTDNPLNDSFDLGLDDNMKINYIVYNGSIYTKFLGKTIFTRINPDSEQQSEAVNLLMSTNAFSTQSSRSLGYLFYLRDILESTSQNKSVDWPSWAEFLSQYTVPAPRINPSLVDNLAKELTIGGTEPPKLFETLNELVASSPATNPDLSKKILKQDAFNTLKKAAGNCDTSLGNAVKELVVIYEIVNGKSSWRTLQRKIINDIKGELIKNGFELWPRDQEFLVETLGLPGDPNSLDRYARNPSIVVKALENWANDEISCLIGLDSLQAELSANLNPGDIPPDLAKLANTAGSPPIRIEFSKTPFRKNNWSAFFKVLEKLATRLVKQLLLGVLAQFFEALLGCSEEETKRSADELAQRTRLYGMIDINNYIQGVDVVQIANDIGLSNKSVTINTTVLNLPAQVNIQESPPTIEQLESFHSDVSQILTPSEFRFLLNGEASRELLDVISEMVNNGDLDTVGLEQSYPQIQLATYGQQRPNRLYGTNLVDIFNVIGIGPTEETIILNLFQESLAPRDTRYAVLGITPESIKNYFQQIGIALQTNNIALPEEPTPEEAYCPNPDDGTPFGDLSDMQIKSQISSEIQNTKNRLDDMCRVDPFDLSWINELNEYWQSIGFPQSLKDFFKWLAEQSRAAQDAAAEWFGSADFMSQRSPSRLNRNECDEFANSLLWNDMRDSDLALGNMETAASLVCEEPFCAGSAKTVFKSPRSYEPATVALDYTGDTANIFVYTVDRSVELLGQSYTEIPALPPLDDIKEAYKIVRYFEARDGFGNDPIPVALQNWREVLNIYANTNYDQNPVQLGNNLSKLKDFLQTGVFRRMPNTPYEPCERFLVGINGGEGNAQPIPSDLFNGGLTITNGLGHLEPVLWHEWFTTPGLEMRTGPVAHENRQNIIGRLPENRSICSILKDIYLHHALSLQSDASAPKYKELNEGDSLANIVLAPSEKFKSRVFPEDDQIISEQYSPVSLRDLRNPDTTPNIKLLNLAVKQDERIYRNRGQVSQVEFPIPDGESASYWVPSLTEPRVRQIIERYLEVSWRDNDGNPGDLAVTRDLVSVSNLSQNTYEQLCSSYFLSDSQIKLQELTKIIFAPAFNESSEKCTDVETGRVLLAACQSYITPFLLNVIPLTRVYTGLNNPSSLYLLADYISRKITKGAVESNVNKIYHDNIDVLFSLYSEDLSDGRVIFRGGDESRWNWLWGENVNSNEIVPGRYQPILNDTSYDRKLKYVVYKYLVSVFSRFSNSPRVISVTDSAWSFDANYYNADGRDINPPNNSQNVFSAYSRTILRLFKLLVADATPPQAAFLGRMINHYEGGLEGPGSEPNRWGRIRTNELEDFYALGSYYLPGPLLLSLYLISYDTTVNQSKTYSQYNTGLSGLAYDANNELIRLKNPSFMAVPLLSTIPQTF